jgi:hydroxypyruvate reductase
VSTAIDAAAAAAARIGYSTHVISRSVDAEARDVGRVFASMVADTVQGKTSFERPCCILAGGETVVHIQGDGTGGRNTEAALSAALRLTGVPDCAIGFLATDGDDGTSGAAGGIVDGTTVGASARRAAMDALAANDSFPFLMDRGGALVTGQSGTNVNDLMIALIR